MVSSEGSPPPNPCSSRGTKGETKKRISLKANGLQIENGTPVPLSKLPHTPPKPAGGPRTVDELHEWCESHVLPRCNTLPDRKFLKEIVEILGPTPLDQFYARALSQFAAGKLRSAGGLRFIAEDTRRAYDATAKLRTAAHNLELQVQKDEHARLIEKAKEHRKVLCTGNWQTGEPITQADREILEELITAAGRLENGDHPR